MLHFILCNALVFKDGKILISQRSLKEEHAPGKWTVPGGKVELTEGNVWNILEATLAREVREEVGVEIEKDVELLTNNTFIRTGGQHVVAIMFMCKWASGEPQALDDTSDVKWVTEEELDNYDFAPNVKEYVKLGFKKLK